MLRLFGVLLILSALSDFVGLVGHILQQDVLSMGTLASGEIWMMAVALLAWRLSRLTL